MDWGKLIQLMHITMVPEQVKTLKIQARVQVSRLENAEDFFTLEALWKTLFCCNCTCYEHYLNLEKLDAVTKNLEVKVEKLTQTVLTNKGNMVEKVKVDMEKARKVKKESVPCDLPIVNPYVPPVSFPNHLKEQEDDHYITRESVCAIGFSKRTHEEELELLISKDTQPSLTKMKAYSCIVNTYEKLEPFINTQ
ncbi:hypothetical protein Tco_1483949 [Tanacetum coccineum]